MLDLLSFFFANLAIRRTQEKSKLLHCSTTAQQFLYCPKSVDFLREMHDFVRAVNYVDGFSIPICDAVDQRCPHPPFWISN
jgi:hypothetical protein